MNRNNTNWFILIVILVALALWVDLSKELINPFNQKVLRNVEIRLGLDLRGGLQTLLEADVPANRTVSADELNVTRQILENRVNGSGVSEVLMQTAGDRRIVAEFPGVSNADDVVKSLQTTGLLEFVDMGSNPVPAGTIIRTTGDASTSATPEATATVPADGTPVPSTDATQPAAETVYQTVFTGAGLNTVGVQSTTARGYEIAFTLKPDAAKTFAAYTSANIGKYLAIVLDKRVISAPVIQSAITSGSGVIQGTFTQQEANNLAVQLRYGSLPIPIKVVESRTVGATLGEESVRKSLLAGAIGLGVVILFMLFYYRLPGLVADLALVCYAIFTLAIYKMAPIVLTLPGIAGFILSVGMAVDANILIFERMKEELRAGRTLQQAIDFGWSRAWPSIRDSNISTLITCLILFIFGSTFGASMVKGFSVNLALGVLVSLFTAIIVTRTFLHIVLDSTKISEHPRWFGL
jgi:preprotein translocase subunit SecD